MTSSLLMKRLHLTTALILLALTAMSVRAQTAPSEAGVRIDVLMREAHERGILNGVVLVAQSDEVVYHRSYAVEMAERPRRSANVVFCALSRHPVRRF